MNTRNYSPQTSNPINCSRRDFMQGTAAALSAMVIAPHLVRGADANTKLSLGLIGCGGRGSWIANLFKQHGGYEIVAAADYFQDRVDAFGQKFNIDPSRRYTGLNGYKKLLESKLDAVAIISPPYFHPKHVYLAKPIAVDVPGCRTISESGRKAGDKKQTFLIDFQTRATAFYQEAIKRVHEGAIGKLTFGETCYQCGALGTQAAPGTPEARLRNWVFEIALSGDIIVEQNIHTLDVMNWVFQKPPLHVVGSGGRKVRLEAGDCWDHFGLLYQYDEGVPVVFNSKQYNDGAGEHDQGISVEVFGTLGRLETKYGGKVMILGKNFYAGGTTGGIYQDGAVTNIAIFHRQITSGEISNTTVEPSVQSNMIAIMGRMAAYQKKLVTWDDLVKSSDKLDPKLDGLKG
jgi:myo-inositol 2-dehydrogenase/D-chiro-inositol 1-dehydrogenase